jgi:hypothetical protein
MVGGDVFTGIGPLGEAGGSKSADAKGEQGTELGKLSHSNSHSMILTGIGTGREEAEGRKWHEEQDLLQSKKKTARTFCCSCREASDATYFQLWSGISASSSTGIYTP